MLEVAGCSKWFASDSKQRVVLDQVDLCIDRPEIVALIGPNGCGKTTLLHLIAGFEQPSSGRIKRFGRVGFLFQECASSLFPWQTVEGHLDFVLSSLGQSILERRERLLHEFQLSNHRSKYPYELSGGLQQLLALARAWAYEPDLFLLDEPFSALDYYTSIRAQELFLRLWEENPIPTVIVTHSLEEAVFLADRIVVLSTAPGRILREISVPLSRPRFFEQRATDVSACVQREVLSTIQSFLPVV